MFKNLFKKKKFFNPFLIESISKAKYLIRLDDACCTQNNKNWLKLEEIFDELRVKPIVAVIPFNKDKKLFYDKEDKNFWVRVKKWEKKGWEIAIHGHSHLYHKVGKEKLVFPFYNRSEFAGLKLETQRILIKESIDFFVDKEINPRVWIAPSHSFDKNTLKALKNSSKINYISDGLYLKPFKLLDMIFIPQQLWEPRKKLYGIWTICLHPNSMNKESISKFEQLVKDPFYRDKFINIDEAVTYLEKISPISYLYSFKFWMLRSIKFLIKKFL